MLPPVRGHVLVHLFLDVVLVVHQRKRSLIFSGLITRFNLHDHARVGPLGVTGGVGHAVQHDGAVLRGRRDQDAAGAHAEGEDAAAFHLLDEGVLGGGHERLILAVITDLVDEPLGMLHADAERKALGLQRPAPALEDFINVAGGMAGSENHFRRLVDRIAHMDLEASRDGNDVRHAAVEMVFTSVLFDAQADVFNDGGELVRSQVRMRVDQDGRIGPESDELVQHLADVAALGGAGEELSVGERTGSAFAVAIIGVRVDDAFHRQFRHVHLAAVDILSALEDDGLESAGEQLQGREQTGRAGADDHDRFGRMDILIFRQLIRFVGLPFPIRLHPVAVQDLLPGIDGTAGDDDGADLLGLDAQSLGGGLFQLGLGKFLADLFRDLKLLHINNLPCVKPEPHQAGYARPLCNGTSRRRRSWPHCRS